MMLNRGKNVKETAQFVQIRKFVHLWFSYYLFVIWNNPASESHVQRVKLG